MMTAAPPHGDTTPNTKPSLGSSAHSADAKPPSNVRQFVVDWLRETRPEQLEQLFCAADTARRLAVGDAVHLRGLIEISNHCVHSCTYCGIRSANAQARRYRLKPREILRAAELAAELGYGTVVLQAGEDPDLCGRDIEAIVRAIRDATGLVVTLSLGERSLHDLARWRAAGAQRYLLRFESSNVALLARIRDVNAHRALRRVRRIEQLRQLGYEVGSGVMVGFAGQDYDTLADDLLMMAQLRLHMIGIGPYLPHPSTPMAERLAASFPQAHGEQVPATQQMVQKCVALARLLVPHANIPSTTALATLGGAEGRTHGLRCGANVVMPNVTPQPYRRWYEIYPNKSGSTDDDPAARQQSLAATIAALGRHVGAGPGNSPLFERERSSGDEPVH